MNIIADTAGQYDALVRLMAKMPKDEFLFLGDMVDRGPDSKKVLDLIIKGKHKALMGNHEHMMLDHCWAEPENRIYGSDIWFWNGGYHTVQSYGKTILDVDQDHLVWIANLPLFYEDDKIFASHAPWESGMPFEKACTIQKNGHLHEGSLIWNRHPPEKRNKLQIFGHNSHWGLKYFGDMKDPWAICLDASRNEVLTGLHVPTLTVYQEPYEKT